MNITYRTKIERVEQTKTESLCEALFTTVLFAVQIVANMVLAYVFDLSYYLSNGNALLLLNLTVFVVVSYMTRRSFSRNSCVDRQVP